MPTVPDIVMPAVPAKALSSISALPVALAAVPLAVALEQPLVAVVIPAVPLELRITAVVTPAAVRGVVAVVVPGSAVGHLVVTPVPLLPVPVCAQAVRVRVARAGDAVALVSCRGRPHRC